MFEKRFTVKGKRYSVYATTQKELTEKELEARKAIEAGLYTENRNITLDAYFDEWIQGKRNSTSENTTKTYISYYRKHISPVLGKKKVQKIERRDVLNLRRIISENLSITSTNLAMRTLKVVLHDAVCDEIMLKSPADGVRALKETDTKAAETFHRALTEEEQQVFMKELEGDFYYEFIALLLCTGMRCGEAAALTWQDVDYKANMLHITKSTTYKEDGTLIVGNTTKSSAGVRDIPINATIRNILARQRTKLGNIFPMNTQTVFLGMNGGLVANGTVNKRIAATLARLEQKGTHIEHFTAHALRDTFATRFIEQGGNPQTLKTILGHSSLSLTMDLYSHVLPNTKQKEMDNLNIAF
jgi:integrase